MPNHKDEIEKLSTAMKEAKSKRTYERYQAIYLHLQGIHQRRNRNDY
ncbi:hypothetical protein HNQ84_001736 [Anoxybacillus eryuanensis]